MVSGFVTSPLDQDRICLLDASPILMASKLLMSINSVSGGCPGPGGAGCGGAKPPCDVNQWLPPRASGPAFDGNSASGLRMSFLDVLRVLLGAGLVGLAALAL